MAKRYNFKALDQRTGRLERACTLLEDGEKAKIKTREPDPLHPLSRPRVIGLDRAQIVQGMSGEQKLEDRQFMFRVGYTADQTFQIPLRSTVALALYSGGLVFSTQGLSYLVLGDGTSKILLGDGSGILL